MGGTSSVSTLYPSLLLSTLGEVSIILFFACYRKFDISFIFIFLISRQLLIIICNIILHDDNDITTSKGSWATPWVAFSAEGTPPSPATPGRSSWWPARLSPSSLVDQIYFKSFKFSLTGSCTAEWIFALCSRAGRLCLMREKPLGGLTRDGK